MYLKHTEHQIDKHNIEIHILNSLKFIIDHTNTREQMESNIFSVPQNNQDIFDQICILASQLKNINDASDYNFNITSRQ